MLNERYIISGLLNKRRWEAYGREIQPKNFSSKESRELFIRLDSVHKNVPEAQDLNKESFDVDLPEVNEEEIGATIEDFIIRHKLNELSMQCLLYNNNNILLTKDLVYNNIVKLLDNIDNSNKELFSRIILLDNNNKVTRYPTGIDCLDTNLLGGISPGELFLLASPPHGGKTHWLISMSSGYLLNSHDVIHFILEDTPSAVLGDYSKALGGDEELGKRMESKQLTLLDYADGKLYTSGMDRALKELGRSRERPLVVVVDYLDIMGGQNSEAERFRQKGICEALRNMANKHNLIMLTATQGDADAWSKKIPTMENLSESKVGKSSTADIIIFWSQAPEERMRGDGRLVTVKARARGITEPVVRVNADWDNFEIQGV